MAGPLRVYPVFKAGGLHAAAIMSIFVDAALKGSEDAISRTELRAALACSEAELNDALGQLLHLNMVQPSAPTDLGSCDTFRLLGLVARISPIQSRLPGLSEPPKASREELCYDSFRSLSGHRYAFRLDGECSLLQGEDDEIELVRHAFVSGAEAWAWWDEFDRLNRIVPTVADWIRTHEQATVPLEPETCALLCDYLDSYDGSAMSWGEEGGRIEIEFTDPEGELVRRSTVFEAEDGESYPHLRPTIPALPEPVGSWQESPIPGDGEIATEDLPIAIEDPAPSRADQAREAGHEMLASHIALAEETTTPA